ncbi:MAG: MBOAT family O-acyltransferase [Pseudomonadota bacterium]
MLHGLANAGLLAVAVMAFAAWLFFSFSGYMDVAISAGMVLGIEVPENFKQPLQAKNFLDFWSRWHITLSDWFRFYIFNPLLKSLMEWIDRPRVAPYLGPVGYFVAFFLMGVWHGRTPVLILYGLVLGAGVSINKLYQIRLIARLGRRGYMARCERKAYQLLAQSLSLAYFALALCFLWQVTPDQLPIAGWAMLVAGLLVFAACMLLAAVTRRFAVDAVAAGWRGKLLTAAQAVAAAACLWMTNGVVPELIYQWL